MHQAMRFTGHHPRHEGGLSDPRGDIETHGVSRRVGFLVVVHGNQLIAPEAHYSSCLDSLSGDFDG